MSETVQYGVIKTDVKSLRDGLGNLPEPLAKPLLIVVSGLPGTGKSIFSRSLSQRFPLAILETDALRRAMFGQPSYTAWESARLFNACHKLIEELLDKGVPVILDATNLFETHRQRLYHIADRLGVKLILVRVEAPVEAVRERLNARSSTPDPGLHSEADWSVYKKMRSLVQPIGRTHYVVDTSRDITPVLDKIVREIKRWLRG